MLNDNHTPHYRLHYRPVFHFIIFSSSWCFPFETIWFDGSGQATPELQIIIKIIKLISELMRLDLFLTSDVQIIEHLLGVCWARTGGDVRGIMISLDMKWSSLTWSNLLQIVPHVSSNRHKIQCHCNLLCPSTHVLFKVISACKKAQWLACLDQALCMGIEASLEE